MCQEYYCDCCLDELLEDLCVCVECYYGDEDFEDLNYFLLIVKWCGIVDLIDFYLLRKCCYDSGDNECSEKKQIDLCFLVFCVKQFSSCFDSGKGVCSGENEFSINFFFCVRQLCDEMIDFCCEELSCNSNCCFEIIDEEGRGRL